MRRSSDSDRKALANPDALWQRRFSRDEGRLAQLVEHLVYTERVGSSSLSSPTITISKHILARQQTAVLCEETH